jgi:stage II sporulation protein D
MIRRLAAFLSPFLCGLAIAQTKSLAPGDATVRLFSTAPVHSLTIESAGQAPRHVTSAKLAGRLELSGQLKVTADDGRSATAAGRWSIAAATDGLHVVVTLPGERYVMAVLATEASNDTQPESLKALAVVARSFALANAHRHGVEGLCDSTHCQAMHLAAEVPARIRDAVLATAGETLWISTTQGERRVTAPFTQSCGGQSASSAAVWGGRPQSWLTAHPDPYCQRQPSAWHADVAAVDVLAALRAEGLRPPSSLQSLRIVQRVDPNDPNSRARRLELAGGGGRLDVDGPTFRFAIDRSLGWNTLRSDWYSVTIARGRAIFDGRGFGHGVGLCQFGATEMARQGRSYREILGFYYPGAKIRIAATDTGWHTTEAHGWTLRTSTAEASLVQQGDDAEAKAQALLPLSGAPIVTVYATTELFRQATGEPGWTLASTRGSGIALQPLEVLGRHGGIRPLLLHEFLHVAVEERAAATTPLWLREGLVEYLATQTAPKYASVRESAAQIDAALFHAGSLAEAQRAHAAAEARVRLLVQERGLTVVLGWLHNGVPESVASR